MPSPKRRKDVTLKVKMMSKKKKPKIGRKYRNYDAKEMESALDMVKKGASVYKAAKQLCIPEQTLRDRVLGIIPEGTNRSGPAGLFENQEETLLVNHVNEMAQLGYGYRKKDILKLASELAIFLGKRLPDTSLSDVWLRTFLKRWPDCEIVKTRASFVKPPRPTASVSITDLPGIDDPQKFFQTKIGTLAMSLQSIAATSQGRRATGKRRRNQTIAGKRKTKQRRTQLNFSQPDSDTSSDEDDDDEAISDTHDSSELSKQKEYESDSDMSSNDASDYNNSTVITNSDSSNADSSSSEDEPDEKERRSRDTHSFLDHNYGSSYSESDESNSDESEGQQGECCICEGITPPQLRNSDQNPMTMIINWVQCEKCDHWVHLRFCINRSVIRRGDVYYCPHCTSLSEDTS